MTVTFREIPPQHRHDAERLKEVGRNVDSFDSLGGDRPIEIQRKSSPRSYLVKALGLIAIVENVSVVEESPAYPKRRVAI